MASAMVSILLSERQIRFIALSNALATLRLHSGLLLVRLHPFCISPLSFRLISILRISG